jgi:peptide-methionine (R)-S-oxide reductase
MTYPVQKTDAEWRALLASKVALKNAETMVYQVTRQAATEPAFTGKYELHWADGIYRCVCCGARLFESDAKFYADCGWPSFWRAEPGAIEERRDLSHGMERIETLCARCGAHLGHVFADGPAPTGLRYCMNSAALDFESL